MTDWRIDNAKHTRNCTLRLEPYTEYSKDWDHDHCEACMAKFSLEATGALRGGYATSDHYRWICPSCFNELKAEKIRPEWRWSDFSEDEQHMLVLTNVHTNTSTEK